MEESYDVIVLGLGAAGMAAAISAAESGLRPLVVEKATSQSLAPNALMSGGKVMVARDASEAAAYLTRCAGDPETHAVNSAWASAAEGLWERLTRWSRVELVASDEAEHAEIEGSSSVHAVIPGSGGTEAGRDSGRGRQIIRGLLAEVERLGIEVRYGTTARRLISDGSGRVVGAELVAAAAERQSVPSRSVHAGGVILATGGFGASAGLRRTFLGSDKIRFYGSPHSTGDGLALAQQAGAGLRNMTGFIGRGIGSFPDRDGGELSFMMFLDSGGYVLVDQAGNRFANEDEQADLRHDFFRQLMNFDAATASFSRMPCFWIFDQRRLEAGPLTNNGVGLGAAGIYAWSPDNSEEIARGWITEADSIPDLAARLPISDPENLVATISAYNASCLGGSPDPFGRSPNRMVPIDRPPFYAVPLYPGGSHTVGGPLRDAAARVLDADGGVIPGLFSAGELGSVITGLYPAPGAALSEAFCFGAIAAQSVASELQP